MTTNNNTLAVSFRTHVMPDEQASKAAGRPIFTEMEVCDIAFPGNSKTRATFPAHDPEPTATRESYAASEGMGEVVTYAMLYNDQYQAFKRGEHQPLGGTPLSEAPFLKESRRRELKALNIHTVEALAGLDGTPLKQIGMGGRELKNQAQAYLDTAAGTADATKLASENVLLREQMAVMQAQMADFIAASKAAKGNANQIDETAENEVDELDDASTEQEDDDVPVVPSPETIDTWDEEQLKVFIAEQTGARPKGNPNRNTLVAVAKEIATV